MMKKFLKSVSAMLMIAVMLLASAVCASAADDQLQVDGRLAYSVGDTLTYKIYLEGTTETITGLEMYIKYDPAYIEVDASSIDAPKLSSPTINAEYDSDTVYMNWLNVTNGVKFSDKAVLISLDFKVLKSGETNIQCWFEELFSNDLTYIKEYTMTAEYSDNGTVVKEDVPPLVVDDPDFVAKNQGQFINYEDGKGEKNADVSDNRQAVTAAQDNNGNGDNSANNGGNAGQNNAQATDGNGNVVVTNPQGVTQPTDAEGNYLDDDGNVLSTDAEGNYVTKDGKIYQAAQTQENPVDIGPVIIVIAIIVIAVAIVVVIVLKNRSGKKGAHILPEKTEPEAISESAEEQTDADGKEDND